MSIEKCPKCGVSYSLKIEEKLQLAEKIDKILKSKKDPYQKKIALFNFLKDLEVGKMETDEKQRIDCLIEGKFYNELAKQKMRDYKKLVVKEFGKEE
jgi:hypothetical protein